MLQIAGGTPQPTYAPIRRDGVIRKRGGNQAGAADMREGGGTYAASRGKGAPHTNRTHMTGTHLTDAVEVQRMKVQLSSAAMVPGDRKIPPVLCTERA